MSSQKSKTGNDTKTALKTTTSTAASAPTLPQPSASTPSTRASITATAAVGGKSSNSVARKAPLDWIDEFDDNLDGSTDNLDQQHVSKVVKKQPEPTTMETKRKVDKDEVIAKKTTKSLGHSKIHHVDDNKESAKSSVSLHRIPSEKETGVLIVRAENSHVCFGPKSQVLVTFAIGFLTGVGGGAAAYLYVI